MQTLADNLQKADPFFIEFEQTFLHGDILYKECLDDAPDILFLHGGEPSEDRSDFFLLRQLLLNQYDLTSCSFDFIGHGSTGGEWQDSSLQQRTRQASDIISACFDSQPFSIVASGMSAYTAIKLCQPFSVRNLVLLAPKVYHHKAYTIPFVAEAFSHMIHASSSWSKSDAWSIMENFSGGVSIIAARKDETVPSEIIYSLYSHAKSASQRQILEIPNAAHLIMDIANHESQTMVKLTEVIADTLTTKKLDSH